MESKAKIAGHPIHPMLIVLPLGLFVMACVVDIVFPVGRIARMYGVAYWNIVGGVIGGAAAAIFGWIDWSVIPRATRAKAIGLVHGFGNMILVAMFAISGWIRYNNPGLVPDTYALAFSFGAILLGLITAWLGGELVDRLGVGVDSGAHLNAPSSLSGLPAHAVNGMDLEESRDYRRAA